MAIVWIFRFVVVWFKFGVIRLIKGLVKKIRLIVINNKILLIKVVMVFISGVVFDLLCFVKIFIMVLWKGLLIFFSKINKKLGMM